MLRSLFHLSEVLRTRPKSVETEETPALHTLHPWSPKTALTPGRYHLIKIRKPQQASSQSPLGLISATAINKTSDQYLYDRRLTTTDEPRVIRLLNIFPGRKSDPIACELRYSSLEHLPYYQAISYCWEGQDPSVTIDCNGRPLRITENLSAAIIALRHEDKSLLVWADAICIDQASIEEKNSQVPLMRLIYQNAALVRVWLGNDTTAQSGREAFDLLRELYHAYENLSWDFNFFMKQAGGESLDSCRLPALRDPIWTSVLELVQRPWFTRAWIIQEVVVSQRALLHCGNMSLDWNEFCFGFLFAIKTGLLTTRPDTFRYSSELSRLMPLMITYICFREPTYQNLDLSSLLQSHRLVEATDPKDKIYALLGLSTKIESQVHGLVPDYSLSTAQIYTDVSRAIISKCSTLDILGVPRTAPNPLIGNVPSWVIDWSLPHLANSLSCKNLQGEYIFDFNATDVYSPKQATFRGSSLILNGHVCDTIERVGKIMDPFTSIAIDELTKSKPLHTSPGLFLRMLHIYIVLQDWRTILKSSLPTRTYLGASDSLRENFCRTLLLNHFQEGYTVAAAINDYERYSIRIAYHVISHISRYPAIVRFLNWYESRLLIGHGLLQAGKDSSPIRLMEMIARLVGRRMVVTRGGLLGLAPELTVSGDCVAIVKGAKVPLILRPMDDAKWELIGDCYIHGIMHGEAFKKQKCEDMEII